MKDPGYKYLPGLIVLGMVLAPFVMIVFFTLLIARRFGRRLNRPVQDLVEAAQRIRRQDLDFTISYKANNEIGQLTQAFETMRRELRQSLVHQWRADEERREMVAALSHDLRTPLTIIQGHVEGLLTGGKEHPERLERYLQIIHQNVKRVSDLVNEMRTVSEIDEPQLAIERHPVDIHVYLQEKAAAYRETAALKGVGFLIRIADQRPDNKPLLVDPNRLAEVFDNLFSNSLRFTPRGGRITWTVNLTDIELSMTFCDTGPGFDPKDLPHVFEKSYRGANESKRTQGHFGMGLYIAKTLVEKHGGRITAYNAAGGGACVELALPLARGTQTLPSTVNLESRLPYRG